MNQKYNGIAIAQITTKANAQPAGPVVSSPFSFSISPIPNLLASITVNKLLNRPYRSNIANQLKNYAIEANISKGVHPHIFRHSYAMYMIFGKDGKRKENAKNVQQVSTYLGHERVETTYKYYLHGSFDAEDAQDFNFD